MATAAEDLQPQDDVSEAPTLSEVEQIAVEKGWKPKNQFAGPEDGWRPAGEWLRKIKAPSDLKREIAELKHSIAGISKAADLQVKREVQEATREIEERFAAAVEAKDTKGAAKAAQDMRDLEREQAPKGDDPETQFQRDNPWYGEDDDATAMAIAKAQLVAKRGGSVAEQLKAARDAVHKAFPELVGGKQDDDTPATPRTPTLNAPGRSVGRAQDKSFAGLPDAARRAADRFYEAAKMRNPDKVPDRKVFDAQYAKDFYAE